MNNAAISIVAMMVLLAGSLHTAHGEDRRLDRAEATVTYVMPIQYRDAAELAAVLRPHFGACAVITADPRTNTLLITGTPSCFSLHQEREPTRGANRRR